eukprot:767558-Hanusia_phi.AAC.1
MRRGGREGEERKGMMDLVPSPRRSSDRERDRLSLSKAALFLLLVIRHHPDVLLFVSSLPPPLFLALLLQLPVLLSTGGAFQGSNPNVTVRLVRSSVSPRNHVATAMLQAAGDPEVTPSQTLTTSTSSTPCCLLRNRRPWRRQKRKKGTSEMTSSESSHLLVLLVLLLTRHVVGILEATAAAHVRLRVSPAILLSASSPGERPRASAGNLTCFSPAPTCPALSSSCGTIDLKSLVPHDVGSIDVQRHGPCESGGVDLQLLEGGERREERGERREERGKEAEERREEREERREEKRGAKKCEIHLCLVVSMPWSMEKDAVRSGKNHLAQLVSSICKLPSPLPSSSPPFPLPPFPLPSPSPLLTPLEPSADSSAVSLANRRSRRLLSIPCLLHRCSRS